MWIALLTGVAAGALLGYALQRGQLCFHSMFEGMYAGRADLIRGWVLGVAIASVGLALLYQLLPDSGLNTGLAFRPVGNVVGGLLIGFGMVVAMSCTSGLFYKLGGGMLGAAVGLVGWAAGELGATRLSIPGPTVLAGGEAATIPDVLGVPRLLFAVVFLLTVVGALWWRGRRQDTASTASAWRWPFLAVALGLITVVGWLLAAAGGASFGPSTVGAVRGFSVGAPQWWLTGFLMALILGAHVAARVSSTLWVRGEAERVRYGQLAAGGVLLGAGGWIGGGCNLGHGLSGAAQLNVSSWVVVAAIAAGVGLGRFVLTGSRRNAPTFEPEAGRLKR